MYILPGIIKNANALWANPATLPPAHGALVRGFCVQIEFIPLFIPMFIPVYRSTNTQNLQLNYKSGSMKSVCVCVRVQCKSPTNAHFSKVRWPALSHALARLRRKYGGNISNACVSKIINHPAWRLDDLRFVRFQWNMFSRYSRSKTCITIRAFIL